MVAVLGSVEDAMQEEKWCRRQLAAHGHAAAWNRVQCRVAGRCFVRDDDAGWLMRRRRPRLQAQGETSTKQQRGGVCQSSQPLV